MLTRDYESHRSHYLPTHAREVSSAARLLVSPVIDSSVDSLSLLSILMDALPNGLIVLSIDQAIVYWNQNAKRLCQELAVTQRYWTTLPIVVSELCEQVVEAGAAEEPVLLEYQTPGCRSYRLTACWLTAGAASCNQRYILVTVEDRDAVLQQDIQAEQKKFHLTNREAEVWLLLKREYTYQAIATALHISLNTVKTHIRNIHAKRHPYQSLPA